MYERISADEREQLLAVLTTEHCDFLENELKRGRRTVFENVMRDEKITAIKSVDTMLQEDEMNVVDWLLSDYDDFGPGNLDGQCACGRPLRYMFTVEHQITYKKIQYGRDHLSAFLNIEVKDINGVINELDKIDHELDELLWKVKDNQYYHEYYERIPDKTVVSDSIKKHIEVNVPLLDRQINRLNMHFEKQMETLVEEHRRIKQEASLEKRLEEKRRFEALLRENKVIEDKLEAERKSQREAEFKRQQQENERVERLLREKKEKEAELVAAMKAQLSYGATFDEIAYSLVLNGQHSAMAISFSMINDFGFDKRMSVSTMDRPFLYYDVLVALKKQVDMGNLIMDESSDVDDCMFYVNPYREEDSGSKIEEVQQQSFSLF